MVYVLIGITILFVLGIIVFAYEIKNAILVDSKKPFLYDDYDPKKDETLK